MKVFVCSMGKSLLENYKNALSKLIESIKRLKEGEQLRDETKKELESLLQEAEETRRGLKEIDLKEEKEEEEIREFSELIRRADEIFERANRHWEVTVRDCAEIDALRIILNLQGGGTVLDQKDDVKIVLLHGSDIVHIAEVVRKKLEREYKEEFEKHQRRFEVERRIYKHLNTNEWETLIPSSVSLWKNLDEIRAEAEKNGDEMIFIPIGGYKIITDIFYLYSTLHRITAYYKHESGKVMRLPQLPVNWDYVLFVLQSPTLLKNEEGDFLSAILNETNLRKELRNKLPYIEPVLRNVPIRKNEKYRKILEKNIATWQDLWIGDLIPETVEHSKSHSKRLLQRFEILYRSFRGSFFDRLGIEDEEDRDRYLFYLYTSAYLHDIGHTALRAGDYDFVEFPEIVREFHNVLTVYEIENSKDFLGLDELDEEDLTAIKLVCLYHRKKMGLTESTHEHSNSTKAKLNAKLMKDLLKWDNVPLIENEQFRTLPEKVQNLTLQVAAMLKFLDELDVQADRTVSESYMKVRYKRLLDESRRLLKQVSENGKWGSFRSRLDELLKKVERDGKLDSESESLKKIQGTVLEMFLNDPGSVDPELRKLSQIAFKLVQFDHFRKHSSIEAVIPVWKEGEGLYVEVFGEDESCKEDIKEQIERIKSDQRALSQKDPSYRSIKLFPDDFSDHPIRTYKNSA